MADPSSSHRLLLGTSGQPPGVSVRSTGLPESASRPDTIDPGSDQGFQIPQVGTTVDVWELDRLPGDVWEAWRAFRMAGDHLAEPFFAPEFSRAVDAARGGDVRVAVVRHRGIVVGVLPHHRVGRIGYPVGRFFNDAHQMIAGPGVSWDWNWLLKQLSLRSFDVHALVGCGDVQTRALGLQPVPAFAAELGDDSVAFLKELGRRHTTIGRQPQKTRKLDREIGPVRWELDCRDPSLLDRLIRWKRDQYRRTHILDLFRPDWTRRLLHELHAEPLAEDARSMRGLLSVLWAGDRPVAAHFGMLHRGRLHYWFPAYDVAMAKYSPGTALFRGIIQASTRQGIRTIDMGYGEQPYKRKQTDKVTWVATGCISRCKIHRFWKTIEQTAVDIARAMPMKHTAKRIVRTVQPDAGIGKLG